MKRALALIGFAFLAGCAAAPKHGPAGRVMIVAVDVADVRSKPGKHAGQYVQDPDQETQVIRGEPVVVLEQQRGWARVECPQQPEYTHHGVWEGYPGWIEMSSLTTDLSKESELVRSTETGVALRQQVLAAARRHLGMPYLWGGRSLHDGNQVRTVTGVDCSGLVNWSFRQAGIVVPRDAREQFMKARPISATQIREGDLIFLAPAEHPDKISHVGFYSGKGLILEAPQSGDVVREIPIEQRFGVPMTELKSGAKVGNSVIYFGTLFEDQ